jgi:hypothetical protein
VAVTTYKLITVSFVKPEACAATVSLLKLKPPTGFSLRSEAAIWTSLDLNPEVFKMFVGASRKPSGLYDRCMERA